MRFAPQTYKKYIEPFLGTGAILGALSPKKAIAGDTLKSLIEIWKLVKDDSEVLLYNYKKSLSIFY